MRFWKEQTTEKNLFLDKFGEYVSLTALLSGKWAETMITTIFFLNFCLWREGRLSCGPLPLGVHDVFQNNYNPSPRVRFKISLGLLLSFEEGSRVWERDTRRWLDCGKSIGASFCGRIQGDCVSLVAALFTSPSSRRGHWKPMQLMGSIGKGFPEVGQHTSWCNSRIWMGSHTWWRITVVLISSRVFGWSAFLALLSV